MIQGIISSVSCKRLPAALSRAPRARRCRGVNYGSHIILQEALRAARSYCLPVGEVFANVRLRNIGGEGMMLIGAMTAFSVTIATGNRVGVLAAMFFAGLLSRACVIVITLRRSQVVSGLALTFSGTGISLWLGEG